MILFKLTKDLAPPADVPPGFNNCWTDTKSKLDLAFKNVKPKDWYFVIDLGQLRTDLGQTSPHP